MSSEQGERLKPEGEVSIFLIYDPRKDTVFLEKRLKESNYYGIVTIHGGAVDPSDNTPMGTVWRETFEEAGIVPIEVISLGPAFLGMSLNYKFYRFYPFLVRGFVGEVVNQEPNKSEFMEVPIDKAHEYLKLDSSFLVLERARAKLGRSVWWDGLLTSL